jgi:hypothetical protein
MTDRGEAILAAFRFRLDLGYSGGATKRTET